MIVLDTNILSEFSRPSPNRGIIDWVDGLPSSTAHITAVTEAELRFGIRIMPSGKRRRKLLARLEVILREQFPGRILPFDSNAARSYADIAAARRAAGRPIGFADCQIAAIARSSGAAVATRNVKDFEGCGVEVINPWSTA